jgi:hypothetical protein
MTKFNVIRKGNTTEGTDRAKRLGYWDAENDGAVVKQFDRKKDADEYAEACNSIWTEFDAYKPQYMVVEIK